jgi:SAM-dependent methyltransferase
MNPVEYERMFAAEERQWWYAGMRAISLALLEPALAGRRARLLDAGCGTGMNVAVLSRFGSAVGVDLAPEALRGCRARAVLAAGGDVRALPFPASTFDVVTSFDVLYHRWVEDDQTAVRELVRVLRPGGLLLARVPALRLLWGAHDEAVYSRHRYTRGELVRLLAGQGLEVVRATYANCFLFPVLLARRTADRLLHRHGSDVAFLPPPLERAFRSLLLLESRLVRRVSLPVGASVLALGRKPAGAAEGSGYNRAMPGSSRE